MSEETLFPKQIKLIYWQDTETPKPIEKKEGEKLKKTKEKKKKKK
jgi:hypothetical protein